MLRRLLILAVAGLIAADSATPRAQTSAPDPAPPNPLTGSISLVSDYIFRGLSQTDRRLAAQAGLEYAHPSGVYADVWASNVSWLSDASTNDARISNSLELDLYAGYRGKISDNLSFDTGLYEYYYPGDYPRGLTRPHTTEVYAALTYAIVVVKYSHTLSNLFGFTDSKNSGYLDVSANYEVFPTWAINAHVGRQRVAHQNALSYTDYKVAITKNFDRGFSAALAYIDTNAAREFYTNPAGRYLGDTTVVLALNKAF